MGRRGLMAHRLAATAAGGSHVHDRSLSPSAACVMPPNRGWAKFFMQGY
ncbi:hypothetical protein SXCC_01547 [Gluconacetobacter sp. SXCC-1]|nr:hypothetical protein SXCC_01547 [Gluconacetobacter sp. SXCC-1]